MNITNWGQLLVMLISLFSCKGTGAVSLLDGDANVASLS
jgi:hypothetical protein